MLNEKTKSFVKPISPSEFIKLLGEPAKKLSIEEIKEIYEKESQFADIVFDLWLRKYKPVVADSL